MIRRPPDVHGETFDLLVVGGSLFACALARDAAQSGLRTLLVATDDLGARGRRRGWLAAGLEPRATSAGVAGALVDRELLLRAAPHCVRPVRALVVAAGPDGGAADAWRSLRRLAATAPRSTLPPPQALDAERARRLWPELTPAVAAGAALAFDGALDEAGLARCLARDAVAAGAAVWPRADVVRAGLDGVELHAAWCERRAVVRAAVTFAADEHAAVAAAFQVDVSARLATDAVARVALALAQPEIARIAVGGAGVLESGAGDASVGAWWHAGAVDDPVDACRRDVPGLALGTQAVQAAAAVPSVAQLLVEDTAAGRLAIKAPSPLRAVTAARAVRERLFPASSRVATQAIGGGAGVRSPLSQVWQRHGSDAAVVARRAGASAEAARVLCPHRGVLAAEVDYALDVDAAVCFGDVVRRLFADGACVDHDCLRRAHDRYRLAAGADAADAEPAAAIAAALASLPVR